MCGMCSLIIIFGINKKSSQDNIHVPDVGIRFGSLDKEIYKKNGSVVFPFSTVLSLRL